MKKQKLILIIIISIALLSLIIYAIYRYIKNTKGVLANEKGEKQDKPNYTGSGVNSASGSTWSNDSFPLKKGSSGKNVEDLQKMINYYYQKIANDSSKLITVDGLFGNQTATSVNALKTLVSLPQDSTVTKDEFDSMYKYIMGFVYGTSNDTSQNENFYIYIGLGYYMNALTGEVIYKP
jgi:hypothetical protein